VPTEALLASLGCGKSHRPGAAQPWRDSARPGQRRRHRRANSSAKRVGPSGFAYGLDMTDEMLALDRTEPRQSRR